MSAMETMMRTILNALDLDVEGVKAEVTKRIEAFEANVQTLNDTLIAHQKSLAVIEKKIDALCEFHNITVTATEEKTDDTRKALSATE